MIKIEFALDDKRQIENLYFHWMGGGKSGVVVFMPTVQEEAEQPAGRVRQAYPDRFLEVLERESVPFVRC